MTRQLAPPRFAQRLLIWTLPRGTEGLTIQGDLLEEYRQRAANAGARAARRWYRQQALNLSWRYLFDPNRSSVIDRASQYGRDAVRALTRTPATTAAAVLSLGIAVGAATAIFSVVNTAILRPLPYRDAHELVAIWDIDIERDLARQRLSPPTVLDYRRLEVFSDVAAWWRPDATLRDAGLETARARVVETTGNLFQLLGVSPAVGPGFPANGPLFSPDRIAVISETLWRDRYRAAPDIVGQTLTLNEDTHVIVGVMPVDFAFPDAVDVWTRLTWDPEPLGRGIHIFDGIGRLQPGVSVEDAGTRLMALTEQLAADHPDTNRRWRAVVNPLLDEVLGIYRIALMAMAGAVALLLLTACLNLSSLLMARGAGRLRELGIRSALGASRGRLIRQLLAESLLLSVVSTVVGVVAAVWLLQLMLPLLPVAVPRLTGVAIDLRLLAFALSLTGVTTIVFGLMPALLATRGGTAETLGQGGRTATDRQTARWSQWLVIGEVTLACSILIAAGLLTRSVGQMTRAAGGVSADDVLTMELAPEGTRYDEWERTRDFHVQVVETLRQSSGVEQAGATSFLPLQSAYRMRYERPDRPVADGERVAPVQHISVDAGYFDTVRARMVAGRSFGPEDRGSTEPVMIINELMARVAFPDDDPIGRTMIPDQVAIGPFGMNLAGRVPFRIIGVVADIQQAELQKPNEPVMYFVQDQFPSKTMYVTIRGPGADLDVLKAAVRAADPSVPPGRVQWLQDWMLTQSAPARLLQLVLSVFALVMAVTAATGLYSLLTWVVSRQGRELAIRQALGATSGRLARQVIWRSVGLAVVGVAGGVALSRLAAQQLDAFLFETSATDPAVVGAAVTIVLLSATLAAAGPARRALRLSAADRLRKD